MRFPMHHSETAAASRTLIESRGARRALGVLGFAALTALGARLAVPLPGTAVPFTLQVVVVLLAGFVLGPRLGAVSQAVYVGAGLAGLPVFAAGGGAAYLLGPTGGYLVAFPVAAAVAGAVAGRWSGWVGHALAGALGVAVVHAGGVSWLWVAVGGETALGAGLEPFLWVDALQIAFAATVGWRGREAALRAFG